MIGIFFDKGHILNISSRKLQRPLHSEWLQLGVHHEEGTLENERDYYINKGEKVGKLKYCKEFFSLENRIQSVSSWLSV
jgi:hypothetical protein